MIICTGVLPLIVLDLLQWKTQCLFTYIKICLKWIKIVKKTTAHSQNMLHVDALYNIKRKKYKTVCAELAFAKVTFYRMVMISYRTCNVFFICYAVGLLQYSKSVWSKVGTLTVYMLISCILMPKNCFRSGKSCKMYAIFTMLSSSEVSFRHF
jgi:membrane protein required for beta-lactamase induction